MAAVAVIIIMSSKKQWIRFGQTEFAQSLCVRVCAHKNLWMRTESDEQWTYHTESMNKRPSDQANERIDQRMSESSQLNELAQTERNEWNERTNERTHTNDINLIRLLEVNAFHEIIYHVLSLCGCVCERECGHTFRRLFVAAAAVAASTWRCLFLLEILNWTTVGFFLLLDFIDCIRLSFTLIKRRECKTRTQRFFWLGVFSLSLSVVLLCFMCVLFAMRNICKHLLTIFNCLSSENLKWPI